MLEYDLAYDLEYHGLEQLGPLQQAAEAAGIDIPQIPGLPTDPAAVAKQLGVDIPALPNLLKEAGMSIPGLPVDPGALLNVLSAKNPGDAVLTMVMALPLPPPLPLVPLGTVIETIEEVVGSIIDIGGKIGDWIQGGPPKRKRKRQKIGKTREAFFRYMNEKPLRIMAGGGSIPSQEFMRQWKDALVKPEVWAWYTVGKKDKVPKWVFRADEWKQDHIGSPKGNYLTRVFTNPKTVAKWYADWLKRWNGERQTRQAMQHLAQQIQRKAQEKAAAHRRQKALTRAERGHGRKLADTLKHINAMKATFAFFFATKRVRDQYGSNIKSYMAPVMEAMKKNKHLDPATIDTIVPQYFEKTILGPAGVFAKMPRLKAHYDQLLADDQKKATKKRQGRNRKRKKDRKDVSEAAAKPKSRKGKAVRRQLRRKERELKKQRKQHRRAARKARNAARRLRRQNARLKKKLARKPTIKNTRNVVKTDQEITRMETIATAGEKMAAGEAAQSEVVKDIRKAVATGQRSRAAGLANRYQQVGSEKSRWRNTMRKRVAERRKIIRERIAERRRQRRLRRRRRRAA